MILKAEYWRWPGLLHGYISLKCGLWTLSPAPNWMKDKIICTSRTAGFALYGCRILCTINLCVLKKYYYLYYRRTQYCQIWRSANGMAVTKHSMIGTNYANTWNTTNSEQTALLGAFHSVQRKAWQSVRYAGRYWSTRVIWKLIWWHITMRRRFSVTSVDRVTHRVNALQTTSGIAAC